MRVLAGIASGMVVLMLVVIAVAPGARGRDGDTYAYSGRYPWWRSNTLGHSGWLDGGQPTEERVGQTLTNTLTETIHMLEPAHACTVEHMSENAYLAAGPKGAKADEWVRALAGQGPPSSVTRESCRENNQNRTTETIHTLEPAHTYTEEHMSDNAYPTSEPEGAKANGRVRAPVGQGPPNPVRWVSSRGGARNRATGRACHSAALPVPAGRGARGGLPGRPAAGGRRGLDCAVACAPDAPPVWGGGAARAPREPGAEGPPSGCESWGRGARDRPCAMRGAAAQLLAPPAPPRHTRSPRARAAVDHPPLAARPPGLDPGPPPPTRSTDWATPRASLVPQPQFVLATPASGREAEDDPALEKAKMDAAVSDYQSMLGGLEDVLQAAKNGEKLDFQ